MGRHGYQRVTLFVTGDMMELPILLFQKRQEGLLWSYFCNLNPQTSKDNLILNPTLHRPPSWLTFYFLLIIIIFRMIIYQTKLEIFGCFISMLLPICCNKKPCATSRTRLQIYGMYCDMIWNILEHWFGVLCEYVVAIDRMISYIQWYIHTVVYTLFCLNSSIVLSGFISPRSFH